MIRSAQQLADVIHDVDAKEDITTWKTPEQQARNAKRAVAVRNAVLDDLADGFEEDQLIDRLEGQNNTHLAVARLVQWLREQKEAA